jgi:hypothetical protein
MQSRGEEMMLAAVLSFGMVFRSRRLEVVGARTRTVPSKRIEATVSVRLHFHPSRTALHHFHAQKSEPGDVEEHQNDKKCDEQCHVVIRVRRRRRSFRRGWRGQGLLVGIEGGELHLIVGPYLFSNSLDYRLC